MLGINIEILCAGMENFQKTVVNTKFSWTEPILELLVDNTRTKCTCSPALPTLFN